LNRARIKEEIHKKDREKKMKGEKTVAQNKKARFQYFIEDRFEAGISLQGTEVKAIREGKANIAEGYCHFNHKGELFLVDANIGQYSHGGYASHDAMRRRKLLMHKKELRKLEVKVNERGFTVVPLRLYFKDGYAKLQIGLGKGKRNIDKRESTKKREADREIRRAMKR
jgi:SsrA-binding protein